MSDTGDESSEGLYTQFKGRQVLESDESDETICDDFVDLPHHSSYRVGCKKVSGDENFDSSSTLVEETFRAESSTRESTDDATQIENYSDEACNSDMNISSSAKNDSLSLSHSPATDERETVGTILVSKCCNKDCLLFLTANDVLTARKRVCALSASTLRQWLVDKVLEGSHSVNGKLETHFNVAGIEVCRAAFCQVYSLNVRKVSRATKSVIANNLIVEHGNAGRKRPTTKCDSAKTWMERYFNLIGDKMPHNGQIHLPSWESRKDVYARYNEDMSVQQMEKNDIISLDMFYKLWRKDFSNVIIPEVNYIL